MLRDKRMCTFFRGVLVGLAFLFITHSTSAQILGDVVDEFSALTQSSHQIVGKRSVISHVSAPLTSAFNGVAVEVGTLEEDPSAFFRFLTDNVWSDWKQARIVFSATGGTLIAGYRQDALIRAVRFEFMIQVDEKQIAVVRNGGVFNTAFDEDLRPAPVLKPLQGQKTGAIIPPPLITRAQWGARPFIGNPVNLANSTYEYLTFHHAAGFSAETKQEGMAQMRAMQDLHQNVRGWSDIGYQFGIDRQGRLYQGRPFMDSSTSLSQVPVLARGAHVGGANTGNIGVVIMGCYHPPEGAYCEEELTPASYQTYVTLFSFLSERYGVSPTLIMGHREFPSASTVCPGDNNIVLLPGLRSDVATLLLSGNEPLGEGGLTASIDSKGNVELNWTVTQDFGIESLQIERITSAGAVTVISDAASLSNWTDSSLAGESSVTYLLIANGSGGRRQELARIELEIASPSDYLLTGAFPNPASNTAQFKYFLSVEGLVTVSFYDAVGRLVREIEAGFQKEDQWYTNTIDVSNLVGGLYFFRITVDGFSGVAFDKTHPLVVVR